MTRIYMNRWFSVAYHYIGMIRNNPDGEKFVFYGTHPDPRHMSLLAADHAEVEPAVIGLEYVQFCVDFCKKHEIDIFIPRLHMEEIARHIHLFDEIGTKVMVCRDIELLEAMMEKDKFYELLQGQDLVAIPEYRVVNTAAHFKQAYEELSAQGMKVCFKPTKAEGGNGFRMIDDEQDPVAELFGYVTVSTTFRRAYETLSLAGQFEDVMVMEMLDGPEYSIDCIATAEGELITAIPRRKSEGRLYLLEDVPELMEISRRIAGALRIPYAFNIQVRYNNGIPKLLEINPRMSGGLYITCLSGINMPYLAVRSIMGKPIAAPAPQLGITASFVEQAVVLDR
ncbi:ATP-grasp domain-containing protein [Paenibacillus oenotherae]|uniref:ATP-grasp domain-containing protein n=1 Tax=Paenibacillus oenotherae TaxID=1435645 RepID=A0ABS7D488_9BACL|nr:ATP-grasp domain-containing protein [Paenibacillus oenotherae]MBW7474661.1 ATP-grasp domain-containing protein [Paenibacillus oenotherae]